jgi:pilus assembly protein CpaE
MYPFKTFLVGCQGTTQSDLRRELADLAINGNHEFATVRNTLGALGPCPAEPCLFLIKVASTADVEQVQHLNDSLAGKPILALVDPNSDPTLLIRAMRAGAAQVVRLPLRSEDFKSAMLRIAVQFGFPPRPTKLIAVVGALEGCGATTLAINLASEIARLQGIRCILAEGSFALSRFASYLDIEPARTAFELLQDPAHLDLNQVRQALTTVQDNFQVLTGSYRAITPQAFAPADVLRLLDHLRQLADVVVLDQPCTFTSDFFEILGAAQQVVLVAQQNMPSLHALRLLLDQLANHVPSGAEFVVLNRYDAHLADLSAERVRQVYQLAEVHTIAGDYKTMQAAANDGLTLFQKAPACKVLADIDVLARKLQHLPAPPSPRSSVSKFFSSLFRNGTAKVPEPVALQGQ